MPCNHGAVASRARWARADETRGILVERFPRAFRPKGAAKVPLKVGIYREVREAAPDLPARRVMDALHDYTTGKAYLRSLTEGAMRIDLDGWPAGNVTFSEALTARKKLREAEARSTAQNGGLHVSGSL